MDVNARSIYWLRALISDLAQAGLTLGPAKPWPLPHLTMYRSNSFDFAKRKLLNTAQRRRTAGTIKVLSSVDRVRGR
jgi:hypothetical protein